METTEIISLVISSISAVLAIVAMRLAHLSEHESRDNYQKTKDVLADIKIESAVIKSTMDNAHKALLDTVTHLLNANLEPPQKPSPEEKTKAKIVDFLMKRADTDPSAIEGLTNIAAQRRQPVKNLIQTEKINKEDDNV